MACSFLILYLLLSLTSGETDWPHQSFWTGNWQPPHLSLSETGETDTGYIFIGVRKSNKAGNAPTIFDNHGDLVWHGPQRENLDFKMQKLFGQDVITYWDAEPDVRVLGYGATHILDSTYKEIYTVTLRDDFRTPSGKDFDSFIDGHEHYITPQNTMLVSALNFTQTDTSHLRRGTVNMWVLDSLFYEIDIKTNKVLFKWDALSHIPISNSSIAVKGGKELHEAWDAYHINSVTSAKYGYLVNFRHIRSIFYINKDGSVRWQLSGDNNNHGDFESKNVTFAWQHDVRIHNETDESLALTLYNNAAMDNEDPGPSTGLAIHVDLVNKKAWIIYELTDPTDHIVSATQGSFQVLSSLRPAHMLVGCGSIPKLKEYDGDGNVVLRGQFGKDTFSANAYRIFKFPWSATPHWDPAVFVNHTTSYTIDLYMSWNGATGYNNWAIFSIPSRTSTLLEGRLLLVHERTGFETHVPLENIDARFIIAVARDGERILGQSSIVELGQINSVCPVIP
ncbi:uncharacterized protein N7496_005511 [Penicillium cataractarum]|uniref:ASST-domain-containing protein n=1 Tax=Penicillium cataractarum TaxID=2100454 RepID=A0A9W9VDL6_9EURO|nr:uncharacterized protein N7496_005511 [Penicillium cataractarum]KAJ5378102.1 hypothetical protein N7496_005511 [Penicillium cataractarum]